MLANPLKDGQQVYLYANLGFVMTDSVNYTKMLVINKDGYL